MRKNTYDVTHGQRVTEQFDHRTEKEHLDRVPQRGDIWFVELGCHPGTSVQDGCRPAFIMSNWDWPYPAQGKRCMIPTWAAGVELTVQQGLSVPANPVTSNHPCAV